MELESNQKSNNNSLSYNTIDISISSEKEEELEKNFLIENSLNKNEIIESVETFFCDVKEEKKKDLRIIQLNDENSANIIDFHDCDNISGKTMKKIIIFV